ncbi:MULTISPECIES: type II toxin-antitoxin system HipA family toxin [Achromobacter]|uniref:type II toxin-antitoxin system HipA family toxin n=1 Tax=Achromobacter TaxID=222 RepID=UPI0025BA8E2A|nr:MULTISPECIES: type II toxin-antitoxin system HipA family toxin [Achromobacter]
MQIDVFFRDVLLGVLDRDDQDHFTFTYAPSVPAKHALAIGMPMTQREWKSTTLFPIFQVSYPEGFLERLLEKRLDNEGMHASEMDMLLASGQKRIGNLRLVPHCELPRARPLELIYAGADFEASCLADLDRVAIGNLPGISGGFPKYLSSAPSQDSSSSEPLWIVKTNDADHPELTVLEFFGMEVSRRMGLPTATTMLSSDREHLYVKRFDVTADGTALQFEDACSLRGLPARDKYASSIERVVHIIRSTVAPEAAVLSCSNLFGQYVLASAIRNGDAHLKNFGVIYSPGSRPQLSPTYDMLTMGAYAPRANDGDALDGMALTLRGTRRWPRQADLDSLAHLCGVSSVEMQNWYGRLCAAISSVSLEVGKFCHAGCSASTAKRLVRMLELWSIGCAHIAPNASSTALKVSRG